MVVGNPLGVKRPGSFAFALSPCAVDLRFISLDLTSYCLADYVYLFIDIKLPQYKTLQRNSQSSLWACCLPVFAGLMRSSTGLFDICKSETEIPSLASVSLLFRSLSLLNHQHVLFRRAFPSVEHSVEKSIFKKFPWFHFSIKLLK